MMEFRKVVVFLFVAVLLFYMTRLFYFTKKKWQVKKRVFIILIGGLALISIATFLDMLSNVMNCPLVYAIIKVFLTAGGITYIIGIILWTRFTMEMMIELENTTLTDYMTGALNRSGIEKAYNSYTKAKRPFYLLVCDLNGTKSINDTFGHSEGDNYITKVSDIIRASIGLKGYLARIGGDEFVILVECLDKHEVENLICNIKRQVYEIYNVKYAGISMGYTKYPDDGKILNELLEAADKKMYYDKKLGGCSRN